MRIQHNIAALNSYRNLTTNNSAVSKNLEKLSSGYRINRAGDDAAGLAISEKMRAQITGLKTAEKNANDGISLVQTAEGALTEVHSMLNRMVELADQSANGTYADEVDRENLQKELTSLKDEINRIADGTNFNGINLLDGSLSAKGGVTKIVLGNVNSAKSMAAAGAYESKTAFDVNGGTYSTPQVGDEFTYTISVGEGTNSQAYTSKLTVVKDPSNLDNANKFALQNENGDIITRFDKATDNLDQAKLTEAFVTDFSKTDLVKEFSIEGNAGKFTLKNIDKGDVGKPQVLTMDYNEKISGVYLNAGTPIDIGVKMDQVPYDEGREIAADSIKVYDGTNEDEAVFTINGHKFVLLTDVHDGTTTSFMNATAGLSSDITILVGGHDGLKKATDPDNFAQNIKKIAEVTGLTVTDAIDESTAITNGVSNGIDAGDGIRLSAGKAATGGLVLQIGDTADSFNQLRVSVSDMHTKAMGIDGIDISTQTGALAAVKKIKDAINYVSSGRGDLGAIQNRLEHTINNLSVTKENMTAAESRIRDTDMAEEMMAYTKNNILVQASQAMLAQANQIPQGVLQLLQ